MSDRQDNQVHGGREQRFCVTLVNSQMVPTVRTGGICVALGPLNDNHLQERR
jgi:hypothetical protein